MAESKFDEINPEHSDPLPRRTAHSKEFINFRLVFRHFLSRWIRFGLAKIPTFPGNLQRFSGVFRGGLSRMNFAFVPCYCSNILVIYHFRFRIGRTRPRFDLRPQSHEQQAQPSRKNSTKEYRAFVRSERKAERGARNYFVVEFRTFRYLPGFNAPQDPPGIAFFFHRSLSRWDLARWSITEVRLKRKQELGRANICGNAKTTK